MQQKKPIRTKYLIRRMVESLGPYKFEAALIYIQTLPRTSRLYGAETRKNDYKNIDWFYP